MYDILTDQLIRIDTSHASRKLASLPQVLAESMRDRVESFPALRPHQRHAWHAFLAQLGAMAMHSAGVSEPPEDAGDWRRLIRALTPKFTEDEPWRLVVDDIAKPAFMQPPAHSADKCEDYKSRINTPDELDILVTSKNHDLKSSVAQRSATDDWLFALISLQTSDGYPGRNYYWISRMSGAHGCRPAFSITPSARPGAHVRRDISALLEWREALLDEYPMREDGKKLVWTMPWDGTKAEALLMSDLDPFYIEICRRIRLGVDHAGRLHACKATSEGMRIEAKAMKGVVGDPWTPIDRKEGKSLTLAPGGFTYERIVDYLSPGDWQIPPLCNPTTVERGDMMLVARGIARGEIVRGMVRRRSKTAGYHERIIPLKPKTVQVLGRSGTIKDLVEIARGRIEQIRIVQDILRHSVATFVARGDSRRKIHAQGAPSPNDLADVWVNKLDEIIDIHFFDDLQTEFESDDIEERNRIRKMWLKNGKGGVVDHAHNILCAAQDSLPCPAIQHYRASASALNLFDGRIHRELNFLFDSSEDD